MKNSVPKLSRRMILIAKFFISCSLAGVYPCYSGTGARNSVYLKVVLGAQALSRASSDFACNIIVYDSIIQKKILWLRKKKLHCSEVEKIVCCGREPIAHPLE